MKGKKAKNCKKRMIKSIKVMLLPNNKQETKLFQYSNAARFAYNWAISKQQENYKDGGKFISDNDLRKEFTQLKKQEQYSWLLAVDCDVTKQAIKDACNSYKRFFKGSSRFPKFKSKKNSKLSFYQDTVKLKFTDRCVKLVLVCGRGKATSRRNQSFCKVRLAEKNRIPSNCKYMNPRITYDGLNWWISVGVECDYNHDTQASSGLGIDLGIKDLAICSDGKIYKNINKMGKVKNLKKKQRRLQRKISKKYLKNKKGGRYCKTSNIVKSEKELLKLNRRLTNIRQNHTHQATSEIVSRKPMFIVLEDLSMSGMMKNKNLSKAIQEQSLYEFRRQIEYKSSWNNIPVIIADRWFPSSKLCSCCGSIKKDLKLSDRIYRCECGNEIDRDYQASLNLMRYGEGVVQSTT